MAFTDPYRQHNYLGEHADDASAEAFITLADWQLGVPQNGVWYYNTTSHEFIGRIDGAWEPITGSIAITGNGEIYVDSTDGNDVTGDGTVAKPYLTLGHACNQQAAPANVAEFLQPITFILAPGVYNIAGDIHIPQRMHVTITGDNCSVTGGTVFWGMNPSWWNAFGLPTVAYPPTLRFVRKPSIGSPTAPDVMISGVTYPQGFHLVTGGIEAYNSNPGGGLDMPDSHTLLLNGVTREDWFIYNRPAGTADIKDAPLGMHLYLEDSLVNVLNPNPSWICGEADIVGPSKRENTVLVRARRSSVELRGVCRLWLLDECEYKVDYRVDHTGVVYNFGKIDGVSQNIRGPHVQRSAMAAESFFGITDPAVSTLIRAQAIIFDEESLISMATACTDLTASFSYFLDDETGAYQRGWWNGYSEYAGNHARTFIPSTPMIVADEGAGVRLLRHACHILEQVAFGSSIWNANGYPLSKTNIFTLELGAGDFGMTSDLTLSQHFKGVCILGQGFGAVDGSEGAFDSATVLRFQPMFATAALIWETDVARLENIRIHEGSMGGGPAMIFGVGATAEDCVFKRVVFSGIVGWSTAVHISDISDTIRATWEDCSTELDKFLHHGSVGGSFVRCRAGNYSFGSWDGVGVANPIVCSAKLEHCVAGDYSYGSIELGTPGFDMAIFSGEARHCIGGDYSFGYSCNSLALSSGSAEHCSAGSFSFGSSAGEGATFSGTALRTTAGTNSFGSTTGDGSGVFDTTAHAEHCFANENSFGYSGSSVGTDEGRFSGEALYCNALHVGMVPACSFGSGTNAAKGVFGGIARFCRSTGRTDSYSFGASQTPAGASVEGTLENCVSVGHYSFGSCHGAGAVTIDINTVIKNCTSDDYSFGYSRNGNCTIDATATIEDCAAGDNSFGFGGENVTVSCSYKRCTAGNNSFGHSGDVTGGFLVLFEGEAKDCSAGTKSFASKLGGGLSATINRSKLVRVEAGGDSFGCNGGAAGTISSSYLEDCVLSTNTGNLSTSTMIRCKKLDTTSPGLKAENSRLRDCELAGSNCALEILDDDVHVYNCTLVDGSSTNAVISNGGVARNIYIAHSRLSHDVSADVTNLIADPHNSMDANYEVF